MNRAVSAAGAKDGLDVRVVEHALEIGQAFRVGAAIDEIFFSDGAAGEGFETPGFDQLDCRLDLLCSDVACGAGDADDITGFEIGWDQQGLRGCGLCRCRLRGYRYAGTSNAENTQAQYGGEKVFSIHLNIMVYIAEG